MFAFFSAGFSKNLSVHKNTLSLNYFDKLDECYRLHKPSFVAYSPYLLRAACFQRSFHKVLLKLLCPVGDDLLLRRDFTVRRTR